MTSAMTLLLACIGALGLTPGIGAGAPVLVVGNGAIQILSARLAALAGHPTSLAIAPATMPMAEQLLYDSANTAESMPVTLLPIAGDAAVAAEIDSAVDKAEGLIIAFDSDKQFLPVCARAKSALQVCCRCAYLRHERCTVSRATHR